MHVGRHGFVHPGDLHLEIEVGAVAQAANYDGCTVFLRCGNGQIVIGRAIEGAAGLCRYRPKNRPDHVQTLPGREQGLFAGVHADCDNQPVAQADGMTDHIQMAIGDGVE